MHLGNKILRVVIDTNVLFSATALPKDSPPTRVLDLARAGKIELFISPFILGELEKNLALKAGWDDERLQALRKKLKGFATIIETGSHVAVIKRATTARVSCGMAWHTPAWGTRRRYPSPPRHLAHA